MYTELFTWPYDGGEPDEGVRIYFDHMYSTKSFLKMLNYLVQGIGFCDDGAFCHFPDTDSPDPEDHFEGVEIRVGYPTTDDIIVSEETFFRWLRIACDKYVALHPEEKQKVEELLAKAPM